MPYVDFAEIKSRVSIEQVLVMLGITLKQQGQQLRGRCPICKAENERGFVVTPSKGLWFCFSGCGGGDQIKLVAKVRGIELRDAALLIQGGTVPSTGNSRTVTVSKERATPPQEQKAGLNPLTYLEARHEAVQGLGVSPETADAFQSGFASKGVLRGRYACPVRGRDGTLLAYVGIAVSDEQSPRLVFHNFDPHGVIFNADRVAEGGDLFVCRDPLAVILAVENGVPVESVVSFLAPITAESLETLASLMDEKKCETVELF